MKKGSIWVVDDDTIYQTIVEKIIEKSDSFTTIDSFNNGNLAINSLKISIEENKILPDIILLDINMPLMNGWEFMNELSLIKSQLNKKIAIYIVSSSIAKEDKEKSKTYSNILGYLSKPVVMTDLLMISSLN
ncbi:response regulator [Flavobacterium sp. K5-23]|uniref:response regulator n=1 Tax=Flavobacterium sp. K5-23 TaxID=2746225 RepID=UPI00200D8DAD|nr:response regulator [Flavobacterium sp. K5-23]UQD57110.1 response regulator [Flavobacterium sp. K5-23]